MTLPSEVKVMYMLCEDAPPVVWTAAGREEPLYTPRREAEEDLPLYTRTVSQQLSVLKRSNTRRMGAYPGEMSQLQLALSA